MSAEIRRQSVTFFDLSWKHVKQASQIFHPSANGHESIRVLIWGLKQILVIKEIHKYRSSKK